VVVCSVNAGSTCKTEKCLSENTRTLINKVGHTHSLGQSVFSNKLDDKTLDWHGFIIIYSLISFVAY